MALNVEELLMTLIKDVAGMKASIGNIEKDIVEIKNDGKIHELEERMRKLENFRYYLMGGAAVIGGMVGFIASKL